jgi:hypothetical protein
MRGAVVGDASLKMLMNGHVEDACGRAVDVVLAIVAVAVVITVGAGIGLVSNRRGVYLL